MIRFRDLLMMGQSVFVSALFPSPHSMLALPPMGSRGRRRRRYHSGKFYTPNGKREVARRLRQIQAGQLRVSM